MIYIVYDCIRIHPPTFVLGLNYFYIEFSDEWEIRLAYYLVTSFTYLSDCLSFSDQCVKYILFSTLQLTDYFYYCFVKHIICIFMLQNMTLGTDTLLHKFAECMLYVMIYVLAFKAVINHRHFASTVVIYGSHCVLW